MGSIISLSSYSSSCLFSSIGVIFVIWFLSRQGVIHIPMRGGGVYKISSLTLV